MLDLLNEPTMRVGWSQRHGGFYLWNGARGERVAERTVEALVACGVLQRDRTSQTLRYLIRSTGEGRLAANLTQEVDECTRLSS